MCYTGLQKAIDHLVTTRNSALIEKLIGADRCGWPSCYPVKGSQASSNKVGSILRTGSDCQFNYKREGFYTRSDTSIWLLSFFSTIFSAELGSSQCSQVTLQTPKFIACGSLLLATDSTRWRPEVPWKLCPWKHTLNSKCRCRPRYNEMCLTETYKSVLKFFSECPNWRVAHRLL